MSSNLVSNVSLFSLLLGQFQSFYVLNHEKVVALSLFCLLSQVRYLHLRGKCSAKQESQRVNQTLKLKFDKKWKQRSLSQGLIRYSQSISRK